MYDKLQEYCGQGWPHAPQSGQNNDRTEGCYSWN